METVSRWFGDFIPEGLGTRGFPWLGEVFVIVLLTVTAVLVARMLLLRIQRQVSQTRNLWDDALLEALGRPLPYLIWIVGLCWAAERIDLREELALQGVIDTLRTTALVALLAWFLTRFIRQFELAVVAQADVDPTTADAVAKLLRLSVIITSALMLLQSFGFSIQGVLAFGGIGGIAVGFAAKDLLANFFGGLMVYLDRPFAVGDWVRSPDKEIEGTVEEIGWRLTRIRTFDQRPLYIPNATFAQISVENPSRMRNRRVYETIGLRYQDAAQVAPIVAAVRHMLENHPEVDTERVIIVNFNAFGPSSLDFFIYVFTKTTEWVRFHEIKQDLLLRVLAIVHEHGADVAYPTTTVHLEANDGLDLRLEEQQR